MENHISNLYKDICFCKININVQLRIFKCKPMINNNLRTFKTYLQIVLNHGFISKSPQLGINLYFTPRKFTGESFIEI